MPSNKSPLSKEQQEILQEMIHAMDHEPLIWTVHPGRFKSLEEWGNRTSSIRRKPRSIEDLRGSHTTGKHDVVRIITKNDVDLDRIPFHGPVVPFNKEKK